MQSPCSAVVLQDAVQSMIGVLDAEPDPQAAFNLVLCTYALGDKEMMKQAFSKLVEVSMLCFNTGSDDSGGGRRLPVADVAVLHTSCVEGWLASLHADNTHTACCFLECCSTHVALVYWTVYFVTNQLCIPIALCSNKLWHAECEVSTKQVVPSDDLEEGDSEDAGSLSLLNDELRQEMRSRRAKMHRFAPIWSTCFCTQSPCLERGKTTLQEA